MHIKNVKYVLGLVLFWYPSIPAYAEVVQVARAIQLPDGQPAANARVLLRSFNIDGSLKSEKRITTDAGGFARAEIEIDDDSYKRTASVGAYLMVDIPGQPLTFEAFDNWHRWAKDSVSPLKLGSSLQIKGRVLLPGGVAVPNADVALTAIPGLRFGFRLIIRLKVWSRLNS